MIWNEGKRIVILKRVRGLVKDKKDLYLVDYYKFKQIRNKKVFNQNGQSYVEFILCFLICGQRVSYSVNLYVFLDKKKMQLKVYCGV